MNEEITKALNIARRAAELKGELAGIGKMVEALANYYQLAPSTAGLEATKVAIEIASALTARLNEESKALTRESAQPTEIAQ